MAQEETKRVSHAPSIGERVTDLFDDLTAETYYGWNFRLQLARAVMEEPQQVEWLEAFVQETRQAREASR